MGYDIRGFIGLKKQLAGIVIHFDKGVIKELGRGVSFVPLSDALFDQIQKDEVSDEVTPLSFLTEKIEMSILKTVTGPVGYIEAEYFGGAGDQHAIFWQTDFPALFFSGENSINKLLSLFDVVAEQDLDEFDTLRLSRFRSVAEWVNS